MKNLKLKSLVASAVLLSSATAFAVPVSLVIDGLRSGSGTHYTKNTSGSSATWDWNGATGVLTATGYFQSSYSVGPSMVVRDNTTNMVIDTTANATTASSYTCTEGTFLGGVGAHGCLNLNLGANFVLDSTAAYNVGGDANCINTTVNPDDTSNGPVRGLGTGSGGSCDPQTASYGNWDIFADTTIPYTYGGTLTIWNGVGDSACIGSTTKNAACADQTYMTFSAVPVPAAVWLFGSGLGLLGLARRRRIGVSA